MGLNNSCAGWSRQVEHFSRKPDHSVVVFDNRGVGNSGTGPREIYKTSEMAKDAVDLLQFLGWEEDRSVHLFGISMGGMISQELCSMIPKRFKSVSFISTKSGSKFDLPPLKGLYMFARLLSKTVSEEQGLNLIIDTLFPTEYLKRGLENGRTVRDEIYENLLTRTRVTRRQTISGVFGQLGAVLSHSCSKDSLKKISDQLHPAKVIVMHGDEDQVIDPTRAFELHQSLPHSELFIFEKAGHAICAQLPSELNCLLERVMDEGNRAFS